MWAVRAVRAVGAVRGITRGKGLKEEKKVKEEKEKCCGTGGMGGNRRLYMRSSRKTCKFWVCCEGGDKY